ncbi:MAG TPA: mevalonate kinase [Oceanobacillus sp.]|nr:mevalonate kinase [Oceanobacillus sp.]
MTIRASAPAKIILFGEHAVVYGKPAIAVPVSSLRAHATVEPSDGGLIIASSELDEMIPVSIDAGTVDNALALTARLVLEALNAAPPNAIIRVQSDIPIASGLGSGAAVSTALARALCAVLDASLDESRLNALIYEVEKMYHGTPSGIDNTVVVYERPVYFVRGTPIETLNIEKSFMLVIGDTGIPASTRVAVEGVRSLYDAAPERIQPLLDEIGTLVEQARNLIEGGNPEGLGALMQRNHTLLQQLTVSSPELDRLVDAALDAGALGAKLSGGGRGGNMIALVTSETKTQVENTLLGAGAARVFTTEVGRNSRC